MSHRLYQVSRRQDMIWTVALVLLFLVKAIERAVWEAWTAALIFGGIGVLLALWSLARGPSLGRAVIEITEDELIFTLPFYIPTKTQRFRLERIRVLRVVGPNPGRRYRLELDDGSREEVRPFFGPWLGPRAVDFLRMYLPEPIRFVEEKPAGFFAQVRGDF